MARVAARLRREVHAEIAAQGVYAGFAHDPAREHDAPDPLEPPPPPDRFFIRS